MTASLNVAIFIMRGLSIVFLSMAACSVAAENPFPVTSYKEMEALFARYACPVTHHRLEGSLNAQSQSDWKLFRTRISEGSKGPVNFCGKYILIMWGCGTECQSGAVIDAASGVITGLPTTEWGYGYRQNSCLLVINPLEEIEVRERPWYAEPAYYQWQNGVFVLLYDNRKEP